MWCGPIPAGTAGAVCRKKRIFVRRAASLAGGAIVPWHHRHTGIILNNNTLSWRLPQDKAVIGIEPTIKVLQTHALPLGYTAIFQLSAFPLWQLEKLG